MITRPAPNDPWADTNGSNGESGSLPVFAAHKIRKVYKMGEVEVEALRGIDVELYQGEFVVLLGPSGSGKSTLLNILGGLDVPTSGVVSYREHSLTTYDEGERTRYRREHVGFVFQFYNLIPSLTAYENVALVTEISRNPMDPDEALGSLASRSGAIIFPRSFPEASSSGWQSPEPSPSVRKSSCATSRLVRSICTLGSSSWK